MGWTPAASWLPLSRVAGALRPRGRLRTDLHMMLAILREKRDLEGTLELLKSDVAQRLFKVRHGFMRGPVPRFGAHLNQSALDAAASAVGRPGQRRSTRTGNGNSSGSTSSSAGGARSAASWSRCWRATGAPATVRMAWGSQAPQRRLMPESDCRSVTTGGERYTD